MTTMIRSFVPSRFVCTVWHWIALILALTVLLFTLNGCAGPGQPPNVFNYIVGYGDIIGGNVLLNQGQVALNKAYTDGKLTTPQFQALNNLLAQARTDITNLGNARLHNQVVTQAQIDAAVQAFTVPLSELLASVYVVTVVPPVATRP